MCEGRRGTRVLLLRPRAFRVRASAFRRFRVSARRGRRSVDDDRGSRVRRILRVDDDESQRRIIARGRACALRRRGSGCARQHCLFERDICHNKGLARHGQNMADGWAYKRYCLDEDDDDDDDDAHSDSADTETAVVGVHSEIYDWRAATKATRREFGIAMGRSPALHDAIFGISAEARARHVAITRARLNSPRSGGQCRFPISRRLPRHDADARLAEPGQIRARLRREACVCFSEVGPFRFSDFGVRGWAAMQLRCEQTATPPSKFLMKMTVPTPTTYMRGSDYFGQHVADAVERIVCFYPQWADGIRQGPGFVQGSDGYWRFEWYAPSVLSADGTLQRLAMDHIVIPLFGAMYGYCDIYLLALLEYDDNEDVRATKQLMQYGYWG